MALDLRASDDGWLSATIETGLRSLRMDITVFSAAIRTPRIAACAASMASTLSAIIQ
ncbi:MAG: hypothetical protein OXQ94_03470 [Gemmatimonadota bacterium]|nr:hypothetical protein [Gemmatimonadota bacterium]MDE2870739.1 hypothetical protein [Gemmatimonadota bacterium]